MSRRKPRGATTSNAPAQRQRPRGARSNSQPARGARQESRPKNAAVATSTRTRVKQPRGRLGRLAKVTVLAGVLVTLLALGGQWLFHQSYFRVQHVTVVGLHHEPTSQVLAASGLEQHPTMLGLNTASVARNLERFAWIDGVTLTKRWPHSVEVQIRESSPVAVAFDSHNVLRFVDRRGRNLGPAPLHTNLPTLEYLSPAGTSWPFQHAGRNAATVAGQLPRAFAAQVSVVTVNWHGVVSLKMTTPVSFIIGPPTQLHAKFVDVASVIAHSTLGRGDVVDVTLPGALAVSGPPPG